MDYLAKILGIKSSKGSEVDSHLIALRYAEGRINEIADFCLDDVRVVREIFYRMNITNEYF